MWWPWALPWPRHSRCAQQLDMIPTPHRDLLLSAWECPTHCGCFDGLRVVKSGLCTLKLQLKDKLWVPRLPRDIKALPAVSCATVMGHTGSQGETTCCKNWWDLEMPYPSLTCVFSRVLQGLKRRNEKRMAGNNFVTSNIKGRRDKSYYLDLSSLHCPQRETAGMTYLQN